MMGKQRGYFEKHYIENLHDGDIHPNQQLLEWSEEGEFYFASSVDELWDFWQAAQKVAVPEGFVLVPSDTIRAIHFTCDLALDSKAVYRSALIEVRDALSEFAEKIEAQEQA